MIGEIVYNNYNNMFNNEQINETIKKAENPQEIMNNIRVYDICILPNGRILSTNVESVIIFDKNFKVIKKINLRLPIGCAFNDKNEIYVSDFNNHCIHVMNFDLEKIKSFGSLGSGTYQLKNPFSICFKNDFLYVCDCGNLRIQIFDVNFKFYSTIKLDYLPFTIKVSDKTIAICGSNGSYFYDLETRVLKKKYFNLIGRINYLNSYFYVVSYSPEKKIICYDDNANLIEEIKLNEILNDKLRNYWDFCIFCFKNDLYLTSLSCSKILKFNKSRNCENILK
jgi:hypothetical protein